MTFRVLIEKLRHRHLVAWEYLTRGGWLAAIHGRNFRVAKAPAAAKIAPGDFVIFEYQ
jgi:hypothetical protein